MTNRERENASLSFCRPEGRGSVEETFFPWYLTVARYAKEVPEIADIFKNNPIVDRNDPENFFPVNWGQKFFQYENYLGFDPVRRVGFKLPFYHFEEKVIEDNDEYTITRDVAGKQVKRFKDSGLAVTHREVIVDEKDWAAFKDYAESVLEKYYTDENIIKAYAPLKEGHERGDYTIRMNLEGFFWVPRSLFGIEPHLYAFYDFPELLHEINEFVLKIYLEKLTKVLDVISPDVIYIMEDLSGSNGPMLSPELFDEFVGDYYKRLISVLKSKGVRHVFVDTDGDFNKLIPNFISAGVDGFLPMDVNAGMDIVAVRREFPELKFIGGYNKLCIAESKEAIDKEFERIMPVIKDGGYIPGADHQVAPSTPLENYLYYIEKLKEVMKHSGENR